MAFSLCTSAVFAVDDDYLSELEEEASNLKSPGQNTAPENNKLKSQQDRFEHLLKFERPSTYHFYTKLSVGEKKKVITTFSKEKKLSVASKQIFDLYFEHKKQ
jgi:hypothetical protein